LCRASHGYGAPMGRQRRPEVAGGYYHVTARGNSGAAICGDDDDFALLFGLLAHAVARFDWQCFAYCLLSNHYHLVLRITAATLSRGMRWLNGLYAHRHNERHGRKGHLFGGRYRTGVIESDRHLAEACRYVDLNPVRAGLCNHPGEWRWSSYGASVGEVSRPSILSLDVVRAFGGADGYAEYVEEGLAAIRAERHARKRVRPEV